MDYKLHWKNINLSESKGEDGVDKRKANKNPVLDDYSQYMANPVAVELPKGISKEAENMDISPIEPNPYALTMARTYCRMQMVKIVLEVLYFLAIATGALAYLQTRVQVDAVAKDPSIASAPEKAAPFQSPDVFRARLPVPKLGIADTEAGKTATYSPFAALRLAGLNKTHLYYRDTKGNIRLTVCSDLQTWIDGGVVVGQQEVGINSPICVTTQYNDGKTVGFFPSGRPDCKCSKFF